MLTSGVADYLLCFQVISISRLRLLAGLRINADHTKFVRGFNQDDCTVDDIARFDTISSTMVSACLNLRQNVFISVDLDSGDQNQVDIPFVLRTFSFLSRGLLRRQCSGTACL